MGFFNQFQNLIEWKETRDDVIFYMWKNREIKKDSKVIIRPGQDAIFLYNGVVEGVFEDEGEYTVYSQIIPFLTTLKSFKFGFNTPLRAEVLFINTKQFLVKWGTKTPINLPHQLMPGGMPIRCFGTYSLKIKDYQVLIDNVAGIRAEFTVDDVKERIDSKFSGALTSAILKEGKDLVNLQAYALEIGDRLKESLTGIIENLGLEIVDVTISSFNYPEQIQKMIEKNASYGMVGNIERFKQVGIIDKAIESETGTGQMGSMMQAGVGMQMGMQMMREVGRSMNETSPIFNEGIKDDEKPRGEEKLCHACGNKLQEGAKFCMECGEKVQEVKKPKFCMECGTKTTGEAKFCLNCGNKL